MLKHVEIDIALIDEKAKKYPSPIEKSRKVYAPFLCTSVVHTDVAVVDEMIRRYEIYFNDIFYENQSLIDYLIHTAKNVRKHNTCYYEWLSCGLFTTRKLYPATEQAGKIQRLDEILELLYEVKASCDNLATNDPLKIKNI